jgi:hypothetical protein
MATENHKEEKAPADRPEDRQEDEAPTDCEEDEDEAPTDCEEDEANLPSDEEITEGLSKGYAEHIATCDEYIDEIHEYVEAGNAHGARLRWLLDRHSDEELAAHVQVFLKQMLKRALAEYDAVEGDGFDKASEDELYKVTEHAEGSDHQKWKKRKYTREELVVLAKREYGKHVPRAKRQRLA